MRAALRYLRKSPAFTAAALAALAIGIGANTAIFSVINAVLLRPLAYPAADRIMLFYQTTPGGPSYGSSAARFNLLRRQTSIFQDVSAYEYSPSNLNLTSGAFPEQIHAIRVSADYFHLFGAPFIQGRAFTQDEDLPNGAPVAIVSYSLWLRRFDADPHIVGKTMSLSGVPYTIFGVLARSFNTELDTPPDVFLPFQIDPASRDHAQYFNVVARLQPGVSLAAANAQLPPASAEFRRQFPKIMGPRDGFAVQPFPEALVADVRPSLLILAAAVGFVLLIACANVANLLLARAAGRTREIAIRAAIGAGRARIIRQLLAESAVLSLAGGALGLFLGLAGVQGLLALDPGNIPRLGPHNAAVSLDWRVLLFAAAVSLITGLLFGLIPALDASRVDLTTALNRGDGRSGPSRRQTRTRALLVVSEIALALVLLIGAALLIRTFATLRAVDPGFDSHNILTLRMSLAGSHFGNTHDVNQLIADAVRRIQALPAVARAGASYNLPVEGLFGVPFNVIGRAATNARYDGRGWMAVTPGYFDIFKIPLLSGRDFTVADITGAAPVAIVDRAFARKFPQADRVILGQSYGPEFVEAPRQIVGVAGDVHDEGLDRNPRAMVYVPMAQVGDSLTALATRASTIAWIVRTRVPPQSLRGSIEAELRASSGGLSVARVRTMEQVVSHATAAQRFHMTLLAIFGAAALLLAAIGIYGVMAYTVEQRTRELGIRIALGARPQDVRNAIVRDGLRLALAGIAIGEIAAFALTRFITSFLYGVSAKDPLAFVAIPALLLAVSLLAAYIPAQRSTRIDPVTALR
ncbi:MAG: ABC transporter permease [Bryobacteraceae bacterium]